MIDLVGKIGSMALIDSPHHSIDYNKFAGLSRQLRPGMIWVSSGATEIGRLDYLHRNGCELEGNPDEVKMDYASQGQAILMQTYRNFIDARYSVRQVLVEHGHFNDAAKRENIRQMLMRAPSQNAVPIINYNDAVSCEENRKMEILKLQREKGNAVELVDNDETAAQIACLVNAKTLLIFSTLSGIYSDINNPSSLISEISAPTVYEALEKIEKVKGLCKGASRAGANGAKAKLEYIKPCVAAGVKVIIASAEHSIEEILAGKAPCTRIFTR
ncbi:MAG: uridylate kinase [Clostridia bacterium]|mgnify:CR=1 FL=1|jgi:glutamate 5-kinase|uniref:amino acid kinase family protein n=1 Tax=Pumilibacter muris TaxID=2941510 RepID=UPI002041C620|nr:uridylate kinase [Pumilibacter muris]MCI8595438.1 uridylate kinase [Clostridia bacterium]